MFEPSTTPRVLALPPGADFPTLLAQGLRQRLRGAPPETMARVEVFVNTARMQARLRDALIAQGPGFLPRIRLIADLAGDSAEEPLGARLELAQLIRALLRSDPGLAPLSAAFPLAESLFRFLDEMMAEGVSLDRLDTLDVSHHSLHWERSLRFIRLIARVQGLGAGTQARLAAAVARLAADWQAAPPANPVIVAGSTGSRGPTAAFMRLIARLPQGAVVLPGFDFDMPPALFDALQNPLEHEDHPQFRFARLLASLNLGAAQVRPWVDTPPPDPARNALVSLALRPAPVTDQWLTDGPAQGDLRQATANMTLIEAPDARAEALAIAFCLRNCVVEGKKAALITPDRTLARRVTAVLDRWLLRPDDSAGRPLDLSAPGRFLRQVAALLLRPVSAEDLIALLKHPLAASETGRGDHLRHLRDLELHCRDRAIPFPDDARLHDWATRHEDRRDWADWVIEGLRLAQMPGERPFADWVTAHRDLAEYWARGPGGTGSGALWDQDAGEAALTLLTRLADNANSGGILTARDYSAVLETLLAADQVREAGSTHPGILIWGTLEARAQGADLVILGGLNEGVWPAAPAPDPWFNRQMRLDAGLLLPERQIGLSAHDFQQAIGAPEVILSRALRDAEAQTVPSRWLNRLINLTAGLPAQSGDLALDAMRARGRRWLDQARRFEADLSTVPEGCARRNPRPAPAPPALARLTELPVTRIETLVRDPYAIYAERILKLRVLRPLAPEADARQRGTVLHRIPEDYVRRHPPGSPGSVEAFLAIAETVLAEDCAWPAIRAHWLARLDRVAAGFVNWNAALDGELVLREKRGALVLGTPPFTLTGQPDRIDRDPDGRLRLYDYKTGSLPSKKQMIHFNKQLLLLSIMATEDAFGLGPAEVAEARFIGLGSAFKEQVVEVGADDLRKHRDEFLRLIALYRRPGQGFTAQRAVDLERGMRDYDPLSRRGEWAAGDPVVTILVGDHDG